ncbi:MAG TPA: glycosyltransferase [Geminicoccaceae bacterium]|nr:glycosyltransferase [Geminicoccus sp.]HMU52777.1 glycosyltransferase [Geminicoccaceae bacterium]
MAAALVWVQHLLGSGHLRRALSLAEALAANGLRTTVASGGAPMPWPVPAGVEIVQLPAARAADNRIASLVDASGNPPDDGFWQARGRVLRELVDHVCPAVIVTEMYPFGRRAFRHEVIALLDHAAAVSAPLVVSSVRDVLVDKVRADRWQEMRDVAVARCDLVLVHGDERLFPFERTFPHAAAIADRTVHTGFILAAVPNPADAGRCCVVVSAGGGAVGRGLIEAALAARPLTVLSDRPWWLVAGANVPQADWDALGRALPPDVRLVRHRDDLPDLIAAAEVSVSQAGYNTVVEGLAGGARMVLVPFDAPGQDEQRLRAGRLAELGLAEVPTGDRLAPATLAAAVDRAVAKPRPDASSFRFDGAARSAESILAGLRRRAA